MSEAEGTVKDRVKRVFGEFWQEDKYMVIPEFSNQGRDFIIILTRQRFSALSTMGKLRVGKSVYDTLEPPDRAEKPCCIPAGTYEITLRNSPKRIRRKRELTIVPWLENVPGFTNIQIHTGNYPQDTDGCICPGLLAVQDVVHNSRIALTEIVSALQVAKYAEKALWIKIIDQEVNMFGNVIRGLMAKVLPQALEDAVLKLFPGNIVEAVISSKIKNAVTEHAGNAMEVLSLVKDCKPELDAVGVALANLSEKMKQNALKSQAGWDDKPAIWFDNLVDKFVGVMKGNKPA